MGELFRSFGESWSYFLGREEPLERTFDSLPEDERATVAVWLVPLDPALTGRARRVQDALPGNGLVRVPPHFLHVTLAELGFDGRERASDLLRRGREALRGAARFTIEFPRLNCFHNAVVAEAESHGIADVARALRGDLGLFLPHLSLAYVAKPTEPGPLRDVLVPLRETRLGHQQVAEVQLCVVPASRTTILEPWTVAGRVALR